MKITDYKIVVAQSTDDLQADVKASIGEGWELTGSLVYCEKLHELLQPMMKRFDPHPGQEWVKVPGKAGVWLDPEAAEFERSFSKQLAIKELHKVV